MILLHIPAKGRIRCGSENKGLGEGCKMARAREVDDIGWLYFIRSETQNAVKIGIADETYMRLRTLQTGNPSELTFVAAVRCTLGGEQELHRLMKGRRIRLEWYHDDDDDVVDAIIDELKAIELQCATMLLAERGLSSTDPIEVHNAICDAGQNFHFTAEDIAEIVAAAIAFEVAV